MQLEKRLEQMERNLKEQSGPRDNTDRCRPHQSPKTYNESHQLFPTSDECIVSDSTSSLHAPSMDTNIQTTTTSSKRQQIIELASLSPKEASTDNGSHTDQPENAENAPIGIISISPDLGQIDEVLTNILVEWFYHSIYPIFPIIERREFQPQYDRWLRHRNSARKDVDENEFPFLLYALLAAAASIFPKAHPVFEHEGCSIYKGLEMGDLLYWHALSLGLNKSYQRNTTSAFNTIAAHGILSLCLVESGNVHDSWVTVGHAIRLYQGLDVDNDATTEASGIFSTQSNLWWCLYILDRSLSTALLKPLTSDDCENKAELSKDKDHQESSLEFQKDSWFAVVADFHVTMGRIYKSVRRIRQFQLSKVPRLEDKLRSSVKKHDEELERYYTKQVLPMIQTGDGMIEPIALQTIAVSSYHIGVVLLYRTLLERLDIADPGAFLRCAEAASNCIKTTPEVIAKVPASHFIIQQVRAIYASTKALLHCIRLARNPTFTNRAWSDVEAGFNVLRNSKIKWPEINQYQSLTEKDMMLTQMSLSKQEAFNRIFDSYGQFTIAPAQRSNEGVGLSFDGNLTQQRHTGEEIEQSHEKGKNRVLFEDERNAHQVVSPVKESQRKRRKTSLNTFGSNADLESSTFNFPSELESIDSSHAVELEPDYFGDLFAQTPTFENFLDDAVVMESIERFYSQYGE